MNFDDIHAILDRTARLTEKNAQEIAELLDSIAEMRTTQERQFEKTDRQINELGNKLEKTDQFIEETNRKLGKQIGDLGNKFGSFTEGMALDSVAHLLSTRFGVHQVARRLRRRDKETGDEIELDYFGYENGVLNRAVIVEIKSQFRRRNIEQVKKKVDRFRHFFPQYNESELFVVIAYVDFESDDVLHEALAEGFYLATLSDEIFRLKTPKGFKGRDFNAAPLLG